MKTRYVYVLRGSEDGIIGVASNMKAAYETAIHSYGIEEVNMTYVQFCKEMKGRHFNAVNLYDIKRGEDYSYIEIQKEGLLTKARLN